MAAMMDLFDQGLCECCLDDDDEDTNITGGSTLPSSDLLQVLHKDPPMMLGRHEFCTSCLIETQKEQCPVYREILEQYPLDEVQAVYKVSPHEGCVYQMSSESQGICLIISNKDFGGSGDRHGTERDVESLSRVFSWLGFKVLLCVDKTAQEMEQVLESISWLGQKGVRTLHCGLFEYTAIGNFIPLRKLPQHGDAFVCCLMSHGGESGVCGMDDKQLPINQIFSLFNGENCPALLDKPKVFFIQACRGRGRMRGIVGEDAVLEEIWVEQKNSTPSEADFLVVRSTVQNYVSYRNAKLGSTFIQTLCSQLISDCPRGEDILTILTEVNNKVSQKGGFKKIYSNGTEETSPTKQVSEGTFTLRKKLVFPVQ